MTVVQTDTGVAATVRSYIVERFLFGQDDDQLSNSTSFMDQRLIDSTGILELVMFLEQAFGIKIADHELVPENLDSLDRIAAFVARKQA